jgi:diguanylate cyclase (GGDEF)-like protein/PAS domain S-box-containing protein
VPPRDELHAIVEATPIAIVVIDERGLVVLANTHALLLFGYDTEEIAGKPVELLVPERLRTEHGMLRSDYFQAPTSRPMDAGLELFVLRKDGTEVPVEIGLNPLQSSHGKLVLAAIVDLTERKRAEERQHTEEHLRLVIDGAANALIMTDRAGRMTLVNSQVEQIFGYPRHELLDQPVEMLVPAMGAGPDRRGRHKDGREVPIEVGLTPMSTRRGEYVLASIVDLTERQHADELRAANARHADELKNSERRSDERSHEHARRLEALLQIASNPRLRESERWTAMLLQGAASIRPGQPFRAMLARVRGDEMVVEAVVDAPDHKAGDARTRIGHVVKLSETIYARLLASGGATASWSDIQRSDAASARVRERGWHALIATTFAAAGSTYILSFASNEVARSEFGAQDSTYIELLGSIFAGRAEVGALEQSLRDEEQRARRHAQRLEELWRIVNDPSLRDKELWLAMLAQAAASIRPGEGFRGMLWRIDGDSMILEAVAASPEYERAAFRAGEFPTQIGSAVPLETSVIGKILAEGGGTRWWDDIQASTYATLINRQYGLHSFAVTTFSAGGARWALSFASRSVTRKPFGEQDTAYIEVLASFFSNHVQQQWQFDRIQHQQSHDVLTGLLNRSQFRSRSRIASSTARIFALILVDVNAFHEINESYGQIVGDALLVEIGNALRQRAYGDEIVGRVGGDIFGIFLPNPKSKEATYDRARDFASVFSHGFSTGDRNAKEFISRTASVGIALAPSDGTTIDTVFLQADSALSSAKEQAPGAMVFYDAASASM